MSGFDRRSFLLGSVGTLLAGCAGPVATGSTGRPGTSPPVLNLSAIPDQDPEELARLYPPLAARLSIVTGLGVTYQAVTDYAAVVRAFQIGDIHLAWVGGLTGVQARRLTPGATAIAQRDIDADFRSLFIANVSAGLKPFTEPAGLTSLAGHTLTFGSETSTSGRLMPQHFMTQAGLDDSALKGKPGFSGSHDATIEAVAAGSFEVGAVNEQVWKKTLAAGQVDLSTVVVLWRTPGYADYHWLARPDLDDVYGAGTTREISNLLFGLDITDTDDKAILALFGAERFIPTQNSNYDRIEAVAQAQGLLT